MLEYSDRIKLLIRDLQPLIERERRYYEQLPVGTQFWVPCSGIRSLGIETGHVGKIKTYLGNKEWKEDEWASKEAAISIGARITHSHTLCHDCSEIIDES